MRYMLLKEALLYAVTTVTASDMVTMQSQFVTASQNKRNILYFCK